MNTTHLGQAAEAVAVKHLEQKGYKIVDRNWKTRWCEIDVVAQKDNRMYFVEVKFRKQNMQGSGLDYITHAKIKQMTRAADMWVVSHNWQDDYSLAAIEVSGEALAVTAFIKDVL